ncbi:MAG: SymE family type I addiction module toxin [Leclercia sp.]
MTTYYSRSPSLHLKGNWLAEAGFSTDTPAAVSVEQGRLMIEPVKGLRLKRSRRRGWDLYCYSFLRYTSKPFVFFILCG